MPFVVHSNLIDTMAAGNSRLTEDQGVIVSIVERATSVISLLGLSFIFLTFIFSAKFRKPINRLMFYAAFGDAIYNIATLIARAGIEAGTRSALCQFQAFVIEMFLLSDIMWCLAMAINVWLTVFKKYDAYQLRALEWKYALINYGIPLIVALSLLLARGGTIYGDAYLWCWISVEWDILRIACLYGPAWVLIIIIAAIYVLAGNEIFKQRRMLRGFGSSDTSQRRSVKPPEAGVSRTTEIQVNTESTNISPNSPTEHGIAVSSPGGPSQDYKLYDVAIGPGDDFDMNQTPSLSRPQKKALHDRNNAAWAYTKCAILFFLALLITWLPSSINRVYSLAYPDRANWGLNLAAAIVLPLMGFWNTIIYIFTSWAAIKSLFARFISRPSERSACTRPPLGRARGASPSWTMMSRGPTKIEQNSSEEQLNFIFTGAKDYNTDSLKKSSHPDSIMALP